VRLRARLDELMTVNKPASRAAQAGRH
jgi:hypothetical protein